MARKRVAETMEPAPDGSRVLVYRREPQTDDLYEVGAWNGVPHFRCRCCAFDTMSASNLLAHLDSHAGSEPAETLETLEVENNGNRS